MAGRNNSDYHTELSVRQAARDFHRKVRRTHTSCTTYNDFINALAAVSVMVDEMTAYIGEQVLEKTRTRFLDSQLIQLYRETAQTERDTT